MSSELKLKLVFDASDAAKAADALPDAMDRASRKGRKSWEGRGQEPGSSGDYGRMAGMDPEIRRKMEQESAKKQKEAEKAAQAETDAKNEEYVKKLKWNSQIQSDADKAAERERKRKEEEYKRNLRFNSKVLEEQNKLAAKADDWEDDFVKKIVGGLTATKVAAGGLLGFLALGYNAFKESFQRGNVGGQSAAAYGTQAKDVFKAQVLADAISDMDEKQVAATAERVASMSQDIATSVSGQGAAAFDYFGINKERREKALTEGFSFLELLSNMADKYETSGQTPMFQQFAKELLGDDWKQYRAILAAGRNVIQSSTMTLKSSPSETPFTSGINQANIQRLLVGEGPIKNPLGGGAGGAGMPSMPFATSLQAMGGGDILSAINRGPMDTIAKATEETAANTRQMVAQDTNRMRRDPNGVISIIK